MALATGDLLFSRAFAELAAGGTIEPIRNPLRRRLLARNRGADAARRRVASGSWTGALSRTLPVEDRGAVPGGLRARRARGGVPIDPLGRFGERTGVAFQVLDDNPRRDGPAERTGKPRGADLLDGTVTLPLIEARNVTASWPPSTCGSGDGRARRSRLRPHRGEWRSGVRARARARLCEPRLPCRWGCSTRSGPALELVADGVVERYS